MSRISFAFRSFFAILFGGNLPADIAQAFGYQKAVPVKAPPPPEKKPSPEDGAVELLGILQRDARLVDFLMEDISAFSDDQIGAAVREVHQNAATALNRHFELGPVIDAVEETEVQTAGLEKKNYKLIGNVPASGKAAKGVLRHKGWRATNVDLPKPQIGNLLITPAEIEVE